MKDDDLTKKKQQGTVNQGALRKRKWRKNRPKVFFGVVAFMGLSWAVASAFDDKEIIVTSIAAQNVQIQGDTDSAIQQHGQNAQGSGGEDNDGSVRYTVSEGDIPAEIFSKQAGYDANDTVALLKAAEGVYDFTSVREGKELIFTFDPGDSRATEVRYEPTGSQSIIAKRNEDDFTVEEQEIVYDVETEVAAVVIESSLYADALNANISEATIIGVGEVFSYSIDFASEIREGDTLKVLYEKRSRDGQEATDGTVLAAVFTASGKDFYAYYFDQGDGEETGYYDEEARVLERQFLKAPLDFYRITSGYTSSRLHPVINRYTAHYQIDYAAPTGTPTFSTAKGTIASVGFETGWGHIVRINHAGGYSTHYAHLSDYAKGITPGTKVDQGEVIGYVGSTGWSTGPHVDYGMRLNGAPVNPLKLELPKGAPIAPENKSEFETVKAQYDTLLQG